jgi:patatin-like phospholipase/acyl hydrolase
MTKKEFHKKWAIGTASVYYYQKRFPEIVTKEKPIDYQKLDTILQKRVDIKEQVKKIMENKKPKEIEFVFTGKNAKSQAHIFIYQLNASNEQILVRDSNYKKYLQIIEHFGDTDAKND